MSERSDPHKLGYTVLNNEEQGTEEQEQGTAVVPHTITPCVSHRMKLKDWSGQGSKLMFICPDDLHQCTLHACNI
jgi:hypothetical protein